MIDNGSDRLKVDWDVLMAMILIQGFAFGFIGFDALV